MVNPATINIDETSSITVERKGIDLIWTVTDHEGDIVGSIAIGYEALADLMFAIQDTMDHLTFVEDKIKARDFAALAIPGDDESARRFELRAEIVQTIYNICAGVADGSIRETDLDRALRDTPLS
jgi:hypothetical protein